MTSENVTLGELLNDFRHFLQACGFHFDTDEYLDVVSDEVPPE